MFGQFQQHGVVKELVDGDIFTKALWEKEGEERGRREGRRGGGDEERGEEEKEREKRMEEREGRELVTNRLDHGRVWLVTKCKEGLSGVGPTKVATCPECACLTHYQKHSNTA